VPSFGFASSGKLNGISSTPLCSAANLREKRRMNVLDCPMGRNDAKAATVKDYLKALLTRLWGEGEGFSGKRPFGNSGWEYDVYQALVANGLVTGTLDEDGYVNEFDEAAANKLILEAIEGL
jgi:hypothetical protein